MFLINTIILTIASSIFGFISVSFNVYISNTISNETLGIYQLIMSVYMFSITLATSGINLASTRIVSEEFAKKNYSGSKKALKQCIIYSLILGLVSATFLFIFAPTVSKYLLHNKISPYIFYIASVSLPFISILSSLNGYFTAIRKAAKTATIKFVEQIITIICTVCFFKVFPTSNINYACLYLILGTTIGDIISFIFSYYLYYIEQKNIVSEKKNIENYNKKIFHIAVPVALTSYIRSGLSTIKQMLIPMRLELSGMTCKDALSKYGIINGMVMPIILFPSILINSSCSLLIPEFSDLNTKKYFKRINTQITRIFKITCVFSICIIGILLSFADGLAISIYNTPNISIFIKILSPLALLIYLDNTVDSILKGLDMQLAVMGVNILDLFVSISFIYFFLPIYGVLGYVLVIFISELLNTSISIFRLKRSTKFKFDFTNWFIKPLFSTIFSSFLVNLFPIELKNILLKLVFQIVLFVIIYILCLIATNCIGKQDLKI